MHFPILCSYRKNTVDTVFFGSVFYANSKKILYSIGEDIKTIAFMRSLAKPLQASTLFDFDIINKFKINSKELAIFSGSHTGTIKHQELLKNFYKKNNLKLSSLLIEPIYPLDNRKKLKKSKLANNCSGKHTMMLILSKYLNTDYNYLNSDSKIQKLIKQKQDELSNYKSSILTTDGCGTPLWGLPYENIIKAYFNLFHNSKYDKLINSIMKYPDLYGGYDRLDSNIIKLSNKTLFSKVGAGGFVIIYNFKKDEIILVKMAHDDNFARKLVTFEILNKLGWIKEKQNLNIYNQKNQITASYKINIPMIK